ncbi:MAG: hypothetical protein JWP88_618 [Flaviaesturariibacter sp.]|nr:hypothetical protein [Flaviaesturariibacter sp.]
MLIANDFNQTIQKTVLFVNGNPVGYTIFNEGADYILAPVENPMATMKAPVLKVVLEHNGHFTICGTEDRDLIDQVWEDLGVAPERKAS